jgi:hypothetical protein
MDSLILFQILEFADIYNINELFKINPYHTNIQDLIDIVYNNQYIHNKMLREHWKNVYTYEILGEFNILYSNVPKYFLDNNKNINFIKNNYIFKQKKLIKLNIEYLFYGYYSKILQSRLHIKDHINFHHLIFIPGNLKLEFNILKKYHNFKFLE